jgi:hypothetical protein
MTPDFKRTLASPEHSLPSRHGPVSVSGVVEFSAGVEAELASDLEQARVRSITAHVRDAVERIRRTCAELRADMFLVASLVKTPDVAPGVVVDGEAIAIAFNELAAVARGLPRLGRHPAFTTFAGRACFICPPWPGPPAPAPGTIIDVIEENGPQGPQLVLLCSRGHRGLQELSE